MTDRLERYSTKRRFGGTPEPRPEPHGARARRSASSRGLSYVIQEHDARRLHYDFRLELDGTLLSWAVPKGPSLDPSVKRLAVHVEDHPVEYGSFEGEIPEGNYGAGTVIVWDRGTWAPHGGIAAARKAYAAGKLKFTLDGDKLHGGWALVKSHMRGSRDKEQWLLIKERDDDARPETEFDVIAEMPGSVLGDAHHHGEAGKPKGRKAVAKSAAKSATKLAIQGAVKAALPATFKPQLAMLVDATPPGDWRYEIKFDGYRVLIRIDCAKASRAKRRNSATHVFTRAGNDWTARFQTQVEAFDALDVDSAWIDGEAVVLNRDGVPDFQALQNAFDASSTQDIVLYLFDLPYLNGYDLRSVPLVQRRALLRALLEPVAGETLRFSEDFAQAPDELLKGACDMKLEGIIGKRADSLYTSGRSSAWIKLKCRRRQEFVIGGYSEPSGSRAAFGALLLGVYNEDGKLRYAGRVGTGFDAAKLRAVKRELDARETTKMSFASAPRERSRTPVHWVKPELVAECEFAEWTADGIVRQAAFVSLRDDKPAKQIVHEMPAAHDAVEGDEGTISASKSTKAKTTTTHRASGKRGAATVTTGTANHASKATTARISKRAAASDAEVAGVRISHPDRVIDKASGTRKLDLVRYFESVAEWILPHLRDRPVALVRAPVDIGGELFFQKHSAKLAIPHVMQHEGLDPGHPPLITIGSVEALIGAAQMGTVELHTWNAVASNIEKPDRVVFDLDPDPSLDWARMVEAAQLVRSLLDELGLVSFCKTSGGKGLHVVVPLSKHAGWDAVKAFSQAVAQHMADTLPKHFAAKMGAQNRRNRIFVDYLRNNRGSSTVAAYSTRARPGLGVSVPLAWDELDATTGGAQWTLANLHERLDGLRKDPWADYAKTRQRITAEMKRRLDVKDD